MVLIFSILISLLPLQLIVAQTDTTHHDNTNTHQSVDSDQQNDTQLASQNNNTQERVTHTFAGTLKKRGSSVTIEDVYVFIPSFKKRTQSDANGRFAIDGIPAGKHEFIFLREGYIRQVITLPIPLPKPLTLYLDEDFDSDDEVVVVGKKKRKEVSKKVLKMKEVKDMPGTGGDAVKAIAALPSVSIAQPGGGGGGRGGSSGSTGSGRTSGGSPGGSNLVVRGSAPEDTVILFDRVAIPFVYHFNGLASVFNTNMLEKMEFYPGGIGVDHGGSMGGILDIKAKLANRDRHSGEFDISLLKSEGFVEGPINDKVGYRVSGRRSYLEIAEPFFPDDVGLVVMPFFTDFQAGIDVRFSDKQTLSIDSISALDGAAMSVKSKRANSESGKINFDFQTFFSGLYTRYKDSRDEDFVYQVSPYYVRTLAEFKFSTNSIRFITQDAGIDLLIDHKIVPRHTLRYGGDVGLANVTYDFVIPKQPDPTNRYAQYAPLETEKINRDARLHHLAFFTADHFDITEQWQLIPGFYFSWFDLNSMLYVDPRLNTRYELGKYWRFKASIGRYSQMNFDQTNDTKFGNPKLPPKESYQYSGGFEFDISSDIELQVEGYYKDMRLLPVADRVSRYAAKGLSRAYGIELLLKHNLTKRFFAWVALTLSVAQNQHPVSKKWNFASYDKPVDGTVVASYQITPLWKVSGKGVFTSGARETPRTLGYYDADHDRYVTLFEADDENSFQNPFYYQIDARTDYDFTWDTWKLTAYLEILNVTANVSPVQTTYNFDSSERGSLDNLPFLPFLGVRARF